LTVWRFLELLEALSIAMHFSEASGTFKWLFGGFWRS